MMRKKLISNRSVDRKHIYNSTKNLDISVDVVVIIAVVVVAVTIMIFTGVHVTASLLNTFRLSFIFYKILADLSSNIFKIFFKSHADI